MDRWTHGKNHRPSLWMMRGLNQNTTNRDHRFKMNRLTVYSYLTRYPHGHTTVTRLPLLPQFTVAYITFPDSKTRYWARQKLRDNYTMLGWPVHGTFARQLYYEVEKPSIMQIWNSPYPSSDDQL